MRFDPEHAHDLLSHVDPGRVRSGRAVGLRDGALLALVAAGLSAVEIATLRASAINMVGGKLIIEVRRHGILWSATLPTDIGARLLAWLAFGKPALGRARACVPGLPRPAHLDGHLQGPRTLP
jgi:hypothetical protein